MTQRISGQVVFEGPFASEILGTQRLIRVYLPGSYSSARKRRYPVLYVHDGQNAFSTVGPWVAFGWGNWQLDKTASEQAAAGEMREIIIVAVDCGEKRYREYRGPSWRPVAQLRADGGFVRRRADQAYEGYTQFLIEELKPEIDRRYRTLRGPLSTGLLGSSMGGVCSLALAWERPDVFGAAASLSGAFQVERKQLLTVLRNYEGPPKPIRIYLDSGVIDYSGTDDGKRDTDAVAAALRRIGWRAGKDLLHYVDAHPLREEQLAQTDLPRDKWKEAETSQHNEFYWRLRGWRALRFMFPV
jgi:predicted alpha/beta superfamily hydrolase